MSYSTAPVAWGRDNLAFVGASHIVGTQFSIRALRTWTDARHAWTDTRYSCSVGRDRTDKMMIFLDNEECMDDDNLSFSNDSYEAEVEQGDEDE
jgi:hypothetical protein